MPMRGITFEGTPLHLADLRERKAAYRSDRSTVGGWLVQAEGTTQQKRNFFSNFLVLMLIFVRCENTHTHFAWGQHIHLSWSQWRAHSSWSSHSQRPLLLYTWSDKRCQVRRKKKRIRFFLNLNLFVLRVCNYRMGVFRFTNTTMKSGVNINPMWFLVKRWKNGQGLFCLFFLLVDLFSFFVEQLTERSHIPTPEITTRICNLAPLWTKDGAITLPSLRTRYGRRYDVLFRSVFSHCYPQQVQNPRVEWRSSRRRELSPTVVFANRLAGTSRDKCAFFGSATKVASLSDLDRLSTNNCSRNYYVIQRGSLYARACSGYGMDQKDAAFQSSPIGLTCPWSGMMKRLMKIFCFKGCCFLFCALLLCCCFGCKCCTIL